jgi:hypothetical protein
MLSKTLSQYGDSPDTIYYLNKYVEDQKKEARHLYHSAGTSVELSSMVIEDMKAFIAMSDKELHEWSNNIVDAQLLNPNVHRYLTNIDVSRIFHVGNEFQLPVKDSDDSQIVNVKASHVGVTNNHDTDSEFKF